MDLPCFLDYALLKKHNGKCNGFNGYNRNCIGFNGNYNSVYWYVMDSIGAMLNPIGKMPKTHWKKLIYNAILMETIGISVMVSIGLLLLLFFSRWYFYVLLFVWTFE